jgi:nucleoside-diphosphate-sugar epimerase
LANHGAGLAPQDQAHPNPHSQRVFELKPRRQARARDAAPRLGRVLVVGGAGYVGSVLTRRLLRWSYPVRVLDAFLYGSDSLDEVRDHPRAEVVHADTRDVEALREAMDGVDSVIYLAEIVGDQACNLDPATTVAINVTATRTAAELARRIGVRRFVYPSSCSVYGATDSIVAEDSRVNPISLYARGKVAVERALLGMADDAFEPVVLRLATVYGLSPRPRFDLVVNLLTARAQTDGSITIDGGDQWRPFVHVADAANAMIEALRQPSDSVSGQVFNVGSNDQNYMIRKIAELVRSRVPGSSIVSGSVSDARNYRVSFDKIRKQLSFVARRTVTDGIDEIRDALEQGLVDDYRQARFSNARALTETEAGRRLVTHAGAQAPVAIPVGALDEMDEVDEATAVAG